MHRYILFRTRQAHFSLLELARSAENSATILALVFGPVLLGLLAVVAVPLLYLPLLTTRYACAVMAGQTLALCLPAWLLRKRVLPSEIILWTRALPIASSIHWLANAAVAGMIIFPLVLAHLVSISVWLYQWPTWLRPIWGEGIFFVLLSCCMSWAVSTCILTLRGRRGQIISSLSRWSRIVFKQNKVMHEYHHRAAKLDLFSYWYKLFWLPFWRRENGVGLQQTVLLLLALVSVLLWTMPGAFGLPVSLPHPVFALACSLTLTVMTDRGDKAVHEQINLLKPLMLAWPMRLNRLECYARFFSLLPALLILLGLAWALSVAPLSYSLKVENLYMAVSCLTQLAIVCLRLEARGRVVLIVISVLLLTAIGSELWK